VTRRLESYRRDPEHVFQPPFGVLDKDYPGWQPVSAEKK